MEGCALSYDRRVGSGFNDDAGEELMAILELNLFRTP
jgi:hypothetical protein